ncbi:hypothetical protein KEM55_001689 [Ascosphaera atra]|nr:hypothetical protein KEM55_001689 [Ascosphaera atra]
MESFYVVPKSVGTASQRHRQQQQAEDDDGFVDALADPETSPTYQQSKGKNKLPRKTREELELENETLKSLSDDLAKRLHMWEINSQSSTMALHQSFRAMKQSQAFYTDPSSPPPLPTQYRQAKSSQPSQAQDHKGKSPAPEQQPSSSEGDTHHAPDSLDARIKELEELLARERRELEQTKRENARLHKSMMRYKEQWDNLVNQARLRGLSRQQRRSSEGGGQRMEAVPEESQEEARHDGAATTRSGSAASAEERN